MNKAISEEWVARVQKCVFEQKNKVNFYETTRIHFTTLQRIIDRKWCDEDDIKTIDEYCDQVEGLTTANHKD